MAEGTGMPRPDPEAARELRRLVMGFRATQLLGVAARLGVADQLAAGPEVAPRLAESNGADPRALYRLLRALVSLHIVTEGPDGAFQLTARGQLLRADVPGSVRSIALLYSSEWLWRAYGRLDYSVETGRPAFDHVHGLPLFAYLDEHPDAAATFHGAMSGFSQQEASAILGAYDFAAANLVVDVGGGQGVLLLAILTAYPRARGVLFDLEAAITGAQERVAAAPEGDRCTLVAGDFFQTVAPGGDVYLLKSILHNWDDERAVAILRSCRAAMRAGGRLLVIERVIAPGTAGDEGRLFDINMLAVLGGRDRSAAEYGLLLGAAGLRLEQVLPTASALSIVVAVADHERREGERGR